MLSREPAVRVYCLGHFRIERGGTALDEDNGASLQRKPLALLKTLIALGGQNVPEQQLTDAVWPDADGDSAHSAFASALHRLRQALGADALPLKQNRLSLNAQAVWCDREAFESALGRCDRAIPAADAASARKGMDEALDLYRGPFLEGEFEPPEILAVRARLHGRLLRDLIATAGLLVKHGEHGAAAALLRQGAELDPTSEEISQELMRVAADIGQLADAEATYQRLRQTLAAMGGASPSPETERLASEIRERAKGRPASEREGVRLSASGSPPPAAARKPWWKDRWIAIPAGFAALVLASVAAVLIYRALKPAGLGLEGEVLTPPEYPSIVVMPFANLSGDPEQESFADGFTDTLITDLSKLRYLLVIASNTSFAYKGRAVDVRRVGSELGVRHVLEGSIQRDKDRVRIAAQLIEAKNGTHLWSGRWDRPIQDLFALQDEITQAIVTELEVKLVEGEQARVWRKSASLEAYDLVRQGAVAYAKWGPTGMKEARKYFLKALEADPAYTTAMALMAYTYATEGDTGWDDSQQETYSKGIAWAEKAIAIDPDDGFAYSGLGDLLKDSGRDIELGFEYMEKAVRLSPNNAYVVILLGWQQALCGREEAGLENVKNAFRLNPYPPGWYYTALGDAYLWNGQVDKAISTHHKGLAGWPRNPYSEIGLIVAYSLSGREADAQAMAAEFRRHYPNISLSRFPYTMSPRQWEIMTRTLKKYGIP
jgi:TolB-like protein/DNA-binding SARP family transcriptional activator